MCRRFWRLYRQCGLAIILRFNKYLTTANNLIGFESNRIVTNCSNRSELSNTRTALSITAVLLNSATELDWVRFKVRVIHDVTGVS